MYLAELHGKLSSRAEGWEDVLTSNVFSFFKYADRKRFLRPFLKRALGLRVSDDDAERAVFHFWPQFEDGTEPDLVLIVGDYYLLFEAKLYAGFSPETSTTRSQLDRELSGGRDEAKSYGKSFKLIALTRDHVYKPAKFACISTDCLCWVNWQTVTSFIDDRLRDGDLDPGVKLFAEDLYRLLDRRRLRSFRGYGHLEKTADIQNIGASVFFSAQSAGYRGAFIGFDKTLFTEGTISAVKIPVFLRRTFFGNLPSGLRYDDPRIFLRGTDS